MSRLTLSDDTQPLNKIRPKDWATCESPASEGRAGASPVGGVNVLSLARHAESNRALSTPTARPMARREITGFAVAVLLFLGALVFAVSLWK